MTEISVVIPTHNRSAWLRLTLQSVLRQRDVDLEVIVVDDGSADDTSQMVGALRDHRVRLLRHDTALGVSATRNHGAAEARGEWLGFIDDDDVWAPDKLAREIQAARTTGRAWAYTGSVNVDAGLRVISGTPPPSPDQVSRVVGRYNPIPGGGSNVVVLRAEFERTGPFDLRLKNTEDWEMWIRLAKHGPPAWVPHPLLGYRVHSANASLDVHAIFEGVTLIEDWHDTTVDRGVIHRWIAESYLRTGKRSMALRHMGLAMLRGQARHVGEDALLILRRRVHRYLRRSRDPAHVSRSEWTREAEQWLNELAPHLLKSTRHLGDD